MRVALLALLLVAAPASAQVTLNESGVLRPDDSAPGDAFGLALDADGDRLAVGAPGAGGTGAVYVFERQGAEWLQVARLAPAGAQADGAFGFSVALDGDRLVAGAPGTDDEVGVAYVFERQGGGWVEVTRLVSPADFESWYGFDVALDGDQVLVTGMNGSDVFRAPTWETQRLADVFSDFGGSVAVHDGRAFVGTSGNLDIPGSVYALRERDGTWSADQTLSENPDSGGDDDYGLRSVIEGAEALVGGYNGTVFSYTYTERWMARPAIEAPAEANPGFGLALDLGSEAGVLALVGAPEFNGPDDGQAWLFGRSGPGWGLVARLDGSDDLAGHQLGTSVVLAGTQVLVGAPRRTLFDWLPQEGGPGAVYVFETVQALGPLLTVEEFGVPFGTAGVGESVVREISLRNPGSEILHLGGVTVEPAEPAYTVESFPATVAPGATGTVRVRFTPSDVGIFDADLVIASDAPGGPSRLPLAASALPGPAPSDVLVRPPGESFQSSTVAMAARGSTVAVGLPSDGPTGTVDVFAQTASGWEREHVLTPSVLDAGQGFGSSVALASQRLAVGASGSAVGAVYVFERSGGAWIEAARIEDPDANAGSGFGASVAWLGDDLLVGAPRVGSPSPTGLVYHFERQGSDWTLAERIEPPGGARIGDRIDVNGEAFVAVGFQSVSVYEREGAEWTGTKLAPTLEGGGFELFGTDAVLGDGFVMVGSPSYDFGSPPPGSNFKGGVYVYVRDGSEWINTERIEAPDSDEEDLFGNHLARSGDVVFVGAHGRDAAGEDAGAVYLLTREGGTWLTPRRITPPDGMPGREFGRGLAAGGPTLVVGPPVRTDLARLGYVFDLSTMGVSADPAMPAPAALRLDAAHPNPFNPSTRIHYALPEAGRVELAVYDVLGRRVRVLVDEEQPAGEHAVSFEAQGLASGLYVYRLSSAGQARSGTVVLVK